MAGHDGSVVQFKMKRHTSLSKLMKAYCERQGLSMRQSRFRFDGRPINEADTPTQLSWTMRTAWMCSSSNWGAWPAAHWGMAWRERHVCWGIAATRPCQTQGCAETQGHSWAQDHVRHRDVLTLKDTHQGDFLCDSLSTWTNPQPQLHQSVLLTLFW